MNCPRCRTANAAGSQFCIGCGIQLEQLEPNLAPNMSLENTTRTESIPSQTQYFSFQNSGSQTMSITNYLFIILAIILKPFTAFKEEINKLDTFKNSAIFVGLISFFATTLSTIKAAIGVVIVKSYSYSSGYTTKWVWENLKEINYLKLIGQNFITYFGIIVAIASVYYIISLILKKQVIFSRLLGISALSIVPMIVSILLLSPLLVTIYAPLSIIVSVLGSVYTLIIVYETMNQEILLDGNKKYYFNLICLSILITAGYYLYIKMFTSSITNDLNQFLNMFQ